MAKRMGKHSKTRGGNENLQVNRQAIEVHLLGDALPIAGRLPDAPQRICQTGILLCTLPDSGSNLLRRPRDFAGRYAQNK